MRRIRFLITVDGEKYTGIFAHSCDAVIDAIDRFPGARRISVKPWAC
jgi:hypothetical protein